MVVSSASTSSARAAIKEFKAESYPATLTDSQIGTNQLSIGTGARVVTCTAVNYHATLSGPAAELTFTPSYSGCTSTGGLPATMTMNGCDFRQSGTEVNETTGSLATAIVCPAGKELQIDIYSSAAKHAENVRACEYDIPPQEVTKAGEYHLEGVGSTREITTTLNESITTKNTVGSKLLCGLATGETGTSIYSGTRTLIGENAATGVHIGLFWYPGPCSAWGRG